MPNNRCLISVRVFTLILFGLTAIPVHAQTIWCKTFKVGCATDADREREFKRCQNLANETYRTALNEAIADAKVWQLQGNTSAQDYAEMRKRGILGICLKRIP